MWAGGEVGANIQRAQPTQTQICRETEREPIYKERKRQRDFTYLYIGSLSLSPCELAAT